MNIENFIKSNLAPEQANAPKTAQPVELPNGVQPQRVKLNSTEKAGPQNTKATLHSGSNITADGMDARKPTTASDCDSNYSLVDIIKVARQVSNYGTRNEMLANYVDEHADELKIGDVLSILRHMVNHAEYKDVVLVRYLKANAQRLPVRGALALADATTFSHAYRNYILGHYAYINASDLSANDKVQLAKATTNTEMNDYILQLPACE